MGVNSASKTINLINRRKHSSQKQTGGRTKRRQTRLVSLCERPVVRRWSMTESYKKGRTKKKKKTSFNKHLGLWIHKLSAWIEKNPSQYCLIFFHINLCFREVKRNRFLWHASTHGSSFYHAQHITAATTCTRERHWDSWASLPSQIDIVGKF